MKYDIRKVAHFIIECQSPLSIGDYSSYVIDKDVVRNYTGLPYIPATSLFGVVRSLLLKISEDKFSDYIGSIDNGSRVVFSSALLIDDVGNVCEGLLSESNLENKYYINYLQGLPTRDHVKISDKGTAVKHAKFDENVVFKGSRFAFNIEFETKDEAVENDFWELLLSIIIKDGFRLGGGTRKGLGLVKVISSQTKHFYFKTNLNEYLNYSSSLINNYSKWERLNYKKTGDSCWIYKVNIKPEDYFIFGSGFGDTDADISYKTEMIVEWDGNKARFTEKILIPATSIKGAVRHRMEFIKNKNQKSYVYSSSLVWYNELIVEIKNLENEIKHTEDTIKDNNKKLEELSLIKSKIDQLENKNFADENTINKLFGYVLPDEATKGHIIFNDVYISIDMIDEKIFNHVSIDDFTGGGIDGALFSEKVIALKKDGIIEFEIIIEDVNQIDECEIDAFELALSDLVNGNLSVGGLTSKGNGVFNGEWNKRII